MIALWNKISDSLLMLLAYPIVMLYVYACNDGGSSYIREADKKAKQYEKAVKAAMVERRKCEPRELRSTRPEIPTTTPPPSAPSAFSRFSLQSMNKQSQSSKARTSPLLDLPYELRHQIITELLGEKTLHITQLARRLGHIRCTCSTPQSTRTHANVICSRTCFHPDRTIQTYRHGEFLDHESGSDDALSLLLTNRQLYHEASRVLYETNTFDVNHPQTLLFLARTLRPARLASIKHLNLTWSGVLPFIEHNPAKAPDDLQTWNEAWRIISQKMRGLKTLRVRMLIYDDEREKLRSGPFLKYARKRWTVDGAQFEKLLGTCSESVRGLKEFKLGVELPEEVVWDVGALEEKIQGNVCKERWSERSASDSVETC